MKEIFAAYLFSLVAIGGWQETIGADIKSAIIGEWRFDNGSFIRLNPKGGFRKDDLRGTYSFVADSVIRFDSGDGSPKNEEKTKQFFYMIKVMNDTAMHVESSADGKFSTKELLRLRRPNRIEQNRNTVITDLTTLAAKAQQYCATPLVLGGGGNSFVGLTADSAGIAVLAGTAFTNNVNGTYSIARAGNADSVVIRGVGKALLEDGKYPTYDVVVKPISIKVNTIK